ncbi:virulence RhuM family protein [Methanobacterium spitsbergense]|uniref:Virulence RhuM family protein n=1 Tax=Methanobacterium spitsbergense TaxID=2874285 RepID=A0A8T5ULE3_9EURY|nr:virulence RhuM family protein [Methanobacterium spitsbergense]MBZ2164504.1 virulence RhuM family protein [Methanobacterium spitsbergense]
MDKDEIIQINEIVLYTSDEGAKTVEVLIKDGMMWSTQKTMAQLFDVDIRTINEHLLNIFESEELNESSTIRKFRIVQKEGKRNISRNVNFYNLDAIIATGYRVNSKQATQFRIWATNTLNEFITKGFVLDDELLKNGTRFGKDYFDELLERIKEIRASERRFYQKITDIYSQCSYDYNKDAETTKKFYASVQNKLHWAITGHTAAEIVVDRVDSKKENLGLSSWKNSPEGKILKSDVTIAKNYLTRDELSELNNIVNMYLDYAENQARRHKLMSMEEWTERMDAFLKFNEYEILNDAGNVSREVANEIATNEYKKFRKIQDASYVSDFDKKVKKYLHNNDT